MSDHNDQKFDIFIIGGGITGVAIARDTAGRGLKVGLAEMSDLGSGTSSASTKLFHGGLRYLEYFEFKLVKESLKERETLLSSMPHISWPLRFVLPYSKKISFKSDSPTSRLLSIFMPWAKGKRPFWLIRLALLLYDSLGGRKILPPSKSIQIKTDTEKNPLKKYFTRGFEYSDCWVDDSRLVTLCARDAHSRGAKIMPRNKVVEATKFENGWIVKVKDVMSEKLSTFYCKLLVNASGPWVQNVVTYTLKSNSYLSIRLVKGSHIVTKRLYQHEKCYFLLGKDGRIVFTIPYENDFTLIGTTEVAHKDLNGCLNCSADEKRYLLDFVNEYFDNQVTTNDVVWSYAGVRPLYDKSSKSSSAISRDYFLHLEKNADKSPLLNIYGGKITTHRKLAEAAFKKVEYLFPKAGNDWTEASSLPGGDFKVNDYENIVSDIQYKFNFLDQKLVNRLVRSYGTDTYNMLESKKQREDLGQYFGSSLYAFEIDWTIKTEWVTHADDFLWRRTKLGLKLSQTQIKLVETYIRKHVHLLKY